MNPEQFEAIWNVLKWVVNVPSGIAISTVILFIAGRKFYQRYCSLEKTVTQMQSLLFGGAFYQKDAESELITMASPPFAALLGNKMSTSEIVGRPVSRIFDHEVLKILRDMDSRLTRNDEVVESNVPINGVLCTIAKRKTYEGNRTLFQVNIHRQDVNL